jgi:hypothetical protein
VRSHLNHLAVALAAAFLLALSGPALAAAATYVVNTTQDNEGLGATCGQSGTEACLTLRAAIEAADAHTGADTISFEGLAAGAEVEVDEVPLPEITEGVTIDGDTASGATAGKPAIALFPVGFDDLEAAAGLGVHGGTKTRIEGLAIREFGVGIEIAYEDGSAAAETEICGNYIGSDLTGEVAKANRTGIAVGRGFLEAEQPADTMIGGDGCAENVIVANTLQGISDGGLRTHIAGNSIGLGVGGEQLPNGTAADPESAGVFESADATEGLIGGPAPGGEEQNLIWFNHGAGVFVEATASEVSIRGNSILGNEGPGIDIPDGEQPAPTLGPATSPEAGKLDVSGTVTGTVSGETVELEFFGVHSCGENPEGQVPLGVFSKEVEPGSNGFSAELTANVPGGLTGITATSTRATGATTEFSDCTDYAGTPRTFVVRSLGDNRTVGACEAGESTCTLRGAIEAADESEALDTIDFGVAGVIHVEGEPLPAISAPVHIDGASAPGYAGEPVVAIDGTGAEEEGPVYGLDVVEGAAVIQALAIGGFREGGSSAAAVHLGGAGSQLCSSWIGIGLGGASLPNATGVEIEAGSEGNTIGGSCGGVVYNYVSGNDGWGVKDFGDETRVGYDNIGISPEGAADGNGLGGILVGATAQRPVIGSALGGSPGPATIAYNEGPGVLEETAASGARVRGNSIYGNAGKGIEIGSADRPTPPTIKAVSAGLGGIFVEGAVSSGEEEPIELDFFASAVCSPLSAGEGETFLGEGEIQVGRPGSNAFASKIAAPPSDDQTYITATATGALSGTTTEFSECFKYVPPEPEPEPEHREETKSPPSDSGANPPATPTLRKAPAFTPTNGEKVVVKPEEGKVLIKLPGTKKYVRLQELKEIPVGAVIDATKGRVTLTSIGPNGEEQTAEFFGGVFRVKQAEGSNLVVLELLDTNVCPAPKARNQGKSGKGASPRAFAASVSARPSSATAGKLWGSGHGNFRTEGHDGSATVRGTIWLVEDRCNGTTFFRTRRGIVSVRDFVLRKTLPLPAGKSYVAGEE